MTGEKTLLAPGSDQQGSVVVVLPEDFPFGEITEISERLLKADVFVPGFIPPPAGLLNPFAFQYEQTFEGKEHYILPDRNLASRIARIGLGEPIQDVSRRLAASVMALAQCLNINFEPSVAFHELAASVGNEAAAEELGAFSVADQARPQWWIDLALGRCESPAQISRTELVGPPQNLAHPLHRWRRNYVIALKIAELELCGGRPADKVLRLIEWMHQDFMIGGPALLLAALYFSPVRRSGVVKGIRSANRDKAIAGVRNVAWDITHLSDFIRRVHENDEKDGSMRFMFATLDQELARVGRALFHLADELDGHSTFSNRLSNWWKPDLADEIADALLSVLGQRDALVRKFNQEPLAHSIDDFISIGEGRLRRWQPG